MRSEGASPLGSRSLLGRVIDLGVARVSVLAGRGLLFLFFGLALDPVTYGRVAVLLTIATMFVVLLDLGLPLLLQRAGAERAPDAERALPGIVVVRAGALVPVLAAYAAVARALLGPEATAGAIAAIGVYVLATPLAQTVLLYLRGTRHTGVEARVTAIQSALEVAAAAAWFALGGEHPVHLFAVLAAIRVAFVVGLAVVAAGSTRALDLAATRRFLAVHRSSLALYAALAVAQFAMLQADNLVLSILRPTEEVGRYFACARVAWLLHLPSELLLGASMARLAACAGQPGPFGRVLSAVHRLSLTWTVLLVAAVVTHPATVAGLFLGDEVGDVSELFALVVVAASVSWCPPFALPLALERRPVDVVGAYGIAAVVSLAAQVALVPRLGAVGAAYAGTLAYAILKVMTLVLLGRRGLPLPRPAELAPAAVIAAGAAVLHGIGSLRPVAALTALGVLGVGVVATQLGAAARGIEVDR